MTIDKNEIDWLEGNINFLFGLYVVFDELRKENVLIDEKLRKILVAGSARSYLGGLASLLDPKKDSKGNENLSIYTIEGVDLKSYMGTIQRLRKLRDKMLAHNDKKSMLKGDTFINENILEIEESFDLLLHLAKIIGGLSKTNMPIDKMKREYLTSIRKHFHLK